MLLIYAYIDYKINAQIINIRCKKFLKIEFSYALLELYFFNIELKFFTRNKNSYTIKFIILFMKIQ